MKLLYQNKENCLWLVKDDIYISPIDCNSDVYGNPETRRFLCTKNALELFLKINTDYHISCDIYTEDPYICDDTGEPKGQCVNCGDKWFNHATAILPENDKSRTNEIRKFQNKTL